MNGKILAPVRVSTPLNLLDNSYFLPTSLVNQRGQTSYTTTWGMSIDRWYLANLRGLDKAQTLSITPNGIRATGDNFAISQRILPKLDDNKVYTMAYQRSDGALWAGTIRGADANPAGYDFSQVTFGFDDGVTIVWAALYEGAYTVETVPPPVPRPYSVELAECRRWYHALHASRWYEATRPIGDVARFEVLGSFYHTPTLIGTPQVYLGDGWHDLALSGGETLSDRTIFRFHIPSDLMTMGSTYLLSGVSGVSCEL